MLVDVHCHLDFPQFKDKLDFIISRAKKNSVVKIINNGTDIISNRKTLELAEKYDIVEASLGIYPTEALKLSDEELENELNFIKKNKNKIIAIGEVGLEFQKDENHKQQKIIFEKFIELSEKTSLPLIVHSRGAEKEAVEMLLSSKVKKVVLHCFNGNKNLIKIASENNFLFSIPTVIVRLYHFQNLVNTVSLKNILTETDAPFLSPFKNKVNEPAFISETIKKISEIKKITKEEAEKIIFMNFQNTFLAK